MNDIKSLIEQCTKWSEERLIFKNGRRETQMLKLMEEMGELASNQLMVYRKLMILCCNLPYMSLLQSLRNC